MKDTKDTLVAEPRNAFGSDSARKLRASGKVPVVLYGKKRESASLTVPDRELLTLLRADTRVIKLKHKDGEDSAIIQEMQFDALSDEILHVDFKIISLDEKVKMEVDVVVKGEPKGHAEGGILDVQIHSVEVECLPSDIPENILVRVDELDIGDMLRVKDIQIDGKYEILTDPEKVVASVKEPVVEEEAEAAGEGEIAEPEVITKGKEDTPEEPAE